METKKNIAFSASALLVSLFMCLGTTGSAQETGGIGYGLKLGTTMNQFNSSGLTIGGNIGGFVSYRIADFMTLQSELLYMLHGGSRDGFIRDYSQIGGNVESIRYTNRAILMHSVTVPVLLGFNLPDLVSEPVTPKLILGFSYTYMFAAFELHDKVYLFTDGTEGIAGKQLENTTAEYEPHQFGVIGGVGLDFNLSSGKVLSLDIRYQHGINDINLFKSTAIGGPIHQQILSVNFGIPF